MNEFVRQNHNADNNEAERDWDEVIKFQRKQPNIFDRIAGIFGAVAMRYPGTHVSKHRGAKRKPKDWRRHRKVRNKMAKASRKRNRPQKPKRRQR